MASIYDLKPRFQALLRPAMRALAGMHVTPNVVTLLALAGSAAVGAAIALNPDVPAVLLLLPAWLFVRMALNAIDGMMARELQMSTTLGAVLNEVGDVLSDFFLYAPLAVVAPAATWHIVGFSIGAMLTEFCGVVTRALGGSRRYDGPMGKSDRAFAVGAVAILTFAAPEVRQHWGWIFAALGGLTLLTCSNRIKRGLEELRVEEAGMMHWFLNLDPVWRMGCIVLVVLAAASIVVAILRSAKPDKDYTELAARVRSWWVMGAVFFGAIIIHPRVSYVFFAAVSFWAMKEFVTLLKTRPSDHKTLVLTFLSIPVQYLWVDIEWYGMFVIFIPVYMFIMLPLRLLFSKETSGFVASASQIQWGLMAFVFGLSHMAYMLTFENVGLNDVDGRMLVLFLVFVVEMSDVLQYVFGKTLGRHPIMPTVSPNKTWEGLLGGIACATLLSLTIRFLTPFSVLETLGVAFLICLAGFGGGAVMSAVKRDFGVKDFGGIIPGHGGMLDRVDSLCYAAPVFFHYVRNFYT